MNQAERFIQFVKQRQVRAIQDIEVSIRIDGDALVVTQRWIDDSAMATLSSRPVEAEVRTSS